MEWTPDLDERLIELWGEGHVTAEIGRRLGRSKNSVVGRAGRLNLPPRASPIRGDGKIAPQPIRRLRAGTMTLPPLASAAAPEHPPPQTKMEELQAQVIAAAATARRQEDIAAKLNVSPAFVFRTLAAHGARAAGPSLPPIQETAVRPAPPKPVVVAPVQRAVPPPPVGATRLCLWADGESPRFVFCQQPRQWRQTGTAPLWLSPFCAEHSLVGLQCRRVA